MKSTNLIWIETSSRIRPLKPTLETWKLWRVNLTHPFMRPIPKMEKWLLCTDESSKAVARPLWELGIY